MRPVEIVRRLQQRVDAHNTYVAEWKTVRTHAATWVTSWCAATLLSEPYNVMLGIYAFIDTFVLYSHAAAVGEVQLTPLHVELGRTYVHMPPPPVVRAACAYDRELALSVLLYFVEQEARGRARSAGLGWDDNNAAAWVQEHAIVSVTHSNKREDLYFITITDSVALATRASLASRSWCASSVGKCRLCGGGAMHCTPSVTSITLGGSTVVTHIHRPLGDQ